MPINPSGGLLAKGHPIAATGVAQICELVWQMRGQAGSIWVPLWVPQVRISKAQPQPGMGKSSGEHPKISRFTHKKAGEKIDVEDIQRELARMNYTLKPLDIVYVNTGWDKMGIQQVLNPKSGSRSRLASFSIW